MRDVSKWKIGLVKRLKSESMNSISSPSRFCDVELGLRLVERLFPQESPALVPLLLSGYPINRIRELNTNELGMLARSRCLLPYFQGTRAWEDALRQYREVVQRHRLYDILDDPGSTAIRQTVTLCPDRVNIYDKALTDRIPHAARRNSPVKANTEYYFMQRNADTNSRDWLAVEFPAYIVNRPSEGPSPVLRELEERLPLTIQWDDLRATAEWMDEKEEELRRANNANVPKSGWASRFERMLLDTDLAGSDIASSFKLDGLFHMVGMVGSGKSTLMNVMAVWAARGGLRIVLVVGDVVDVIETADRFVNLGLKATPILGEHSRDEHRRKLEKIVQNDAAMASDTSFAPWKDSRLRWTSPICVLGQFLKNRGDSPGISPGEEPCDRLMNKMDMGSRRHNCPLESLCPVKRARTQMADAQIWVATPASLLSTRAPRNAIDSNIRMLELAYRRSDVIIVDETDRVQMQMDDSFAPSDVLIGENNSNGWMQQVNFAIAESAGISISGAMREYGIDNWTNNQTMAFNATRGLIALGVRNVEIHNWLGEPRQNLFSAFMLADRLHRETIKDLGLEIALPVELTQVLDDFMDGDSLLHIMAMRLATDHESATLEATENRVVEWLESSYYHGLSDLVNVGLFRLKLKAVMFTTLMEYYLKLMVDGWDVAESVYDLSSRANQLFQRPPRDYAPIMPVLPMGNIFGFRYRKAGADYRDAEISFIRGVGMGRWIITHLHDLFQDLDGIPGPHVMLVSGSSWAPGSSDYHVEAEVNAILRVPSDEVAAIEKTQCFFETAPYFDGGPAIRVSGTQAQRRLDALTGIIKHLTERVSSPSGKNRLEREIERLDSERRRILMIVGSYDEAKQVASQLNRMLGGSDLRNCVFRLERDDFGETTDPLRPDGLSEDRGYLQRGLVRNFANQSPGILVAPYGAIGRGHNIVLADGMAAIGSIYFLIRSLEVPYQFDSAVRDVNSLAMRQWESQGYVRGSLVEYIQKDRGRWMGEWRKALANPSFYGRSDKRQHDDVVWTQLVSIWQTVGRGVRGGAPVRVHFCDAAFAPRTARGKYGKDSIHTSLLVGMRDILDKFNRMDGRDSAITKALYSPWSNALSNIDGLD